ncbi:MAG: nickel-dependent lactate racemase [Candidatus Omnitrophica bacterium]|nr:nickel-dependent lactate racemase [Candidatus Omnitrophota bacterium]
MKVRLDYDREGLKVEVPDINLAGILQLPDVKPVTDLEESLEMALLHPIGTKPLQELARGRKSVCIVISDPTRPMPTKLILPTILKQLENAGISKGKITILIATGLHRAPERDELFEMLGRKIVNNYRIINHNARDKELKFLGYTENKTPIFINSHYLNAEFKIVTGLIEPHFMAGYSGGRKGICPGISGLETTKKTHSPDYLESPYAAAGILKNNPFHQEILEIAKKAGADFLINLILNREREITGIFAGDLEKTWLKGVKELEKVVKIAVGKPADIVITSGGGYPLDTTFYQSIKGMVTAMNIVKDKGTVIIASNCKGGIGNREFENLLRKTKDRGEFLAKIKQPHFFIIDQWQIEEMCKVLRKAEIMFYSDNLNNEILRELMVAPIDSVEEGIQKALKKHGKSAKIIVIPQGPYVIPVLQNNYIAT